MVRDYERIIKHLRQRYTYDAAQGVVHNRKNQVIKGFNNNYGYLLLNIRVDGRRSHLRLHQIVWVLNYGKLPSMIDHINGNPKDNRIENLREVSQSENDMNRLLAWKPNASTGLPGVYKNNNSFNINVQGKRLKFRDKYEAFHALTMLGRMFRPE